MQTFNCTIMNVSKSGKSVQIAVDVPQETALGTIYGSVTGYIGIGEDFKGEKGGTFEVTANELVHTRSSEPLTLESGEQVYFHRISFK